MIVSLILPSLTLGIGLVTVTWLSRRASLHNALIAVGLLLVAVMLLGIPPVPPISSKHRIAPPPLRTRMDQLTVAVETSTVVLPCWHSVSVQLCRQLNYLQGENMVRCGAL